MKHGGELRINDLLQNLDVDGDGDIDEEDRQLAETLKSMDKDGDGTITLRELVTIGQSKLEDKARINYLKRAIFLVILCSLVFCGAMLGLMLAANEASKDSKPQSSGALKTIDGKDVSTTATLSKLSLAMLPKLPPASLEKVTTLRIKTEDSLQFYQVSGWEWKSEMQMSFFTTRGHVVSIENGKIGITDGAGGALVVVSRRRSLLSVDEDLEYASFEGGDVDLGEWNGDDEAGSGSTPAPSPAPLTPCLPSEYMPISAACKCAAASTTKECTVGKFCYDGACQAIAKPLPPEPCKPSGDTAIVYDCKCAAASTTNECTKGKFCYNGACRGVAIAATTLCPNCYNYHAELAQCQLGLQGGPDTENNRIMKQSAFYNCLTKMQTAAVTAAATVVVPEAAKTAETGYKAKVATCFTQAQAGGLVGFTLQQINGEMGVGGKMRTAFSGFCKDFSFWMDMHFCLQKTTSADYVQCHLATECGSQTYTGTMGGAMNSLCPPVVAIMNNQG